MRWGQKVEEGSANQSQVESSFTHGLSLLMMFCGSCVDVFFVSKLRIIESSFHFKLL